MHSLALGLATLRAHRRNHAQQGQGPRHDTARWFGCLVWPQPLRKPPPLLHLLTTTPRFRHKQSRRAEKASRPRGWERSRTGVGGGLLS